MLGACEPEEPSHGSSSPIVWKVGPHLPVAVSGNVVVAMEVDSGVSVFSFLGEDSTRAAGHLTNAAYRWKVGSKSWTPVAPVPGPSRLGATAQVVHGRIYIVGGYTVSADGSRHTLARVDVYDPSTNRWSRGPSMPVSVHDAAGGVWRDSLVLVLAGRHDGRDVRDVQWFDPARGRWFSGTRIPGEAVFGMAGTVVGDRIIFTDGQEAGHEGTVMDTTAWEGTVKPSDPASITWGALPRHPGPMVYRAASGTVGRFALFVGGAQRPYGDDGRGPDGAPVAPVRQALSYQPGTGVWRHLPSPPIASMDHRTLGVAQGMVFLVGGMERGPHVSNKVWYASVEGLLADR